MPIPFVGKRFTPSQFKKYLDDTDLSGSFKPKFVTLHHTASPSLAQRPQGFTEQHLKNLRHYYENQLGWSGAPHLFIDDREDGIIVFQRLDKRGVHAVSFNRNSWGIEMLGYFDVEAFDKGRGAKVRDLTIEAIALMNKKIGASPDSLKFHRDDPYTSKSCPGRLVLKPDVIERVAKLMKEPAPSEMVVTTQFQDWKVFLPGGVEFTPIRQRDGRPIARVRQVLDMVATGGSYNLVNEKRAIQWTKPDGKSLQIPVAELDENGVGWAFVRDLADAVGRKLKVEGRTVTVV